LLFELPRCDSLQVLLLQVDLRFLLAQRICEHILLNFLGLGLQPGGLLASRLEVVEASNFVSPVGQGERRSHFNEADVLFLHEDLRNLFAFVSLHDHLLLIQCRKYYELFSFHNVD